jgi:hypothetical protein
MPDFPFPKCSPSTERVGNLTQFNLNTYKIFPPLKTRGKCVETSAHDWKQLLASLNMTFHEWPNECPTHRGCTSTHFHAWKLSGHVGMHENALSTDLCPTTAILEASAGPGSRCIDISVFGVKFAVNLERDVTLWLSRLVPCLQTTEVRGSTVCSVCLRETIPCRHHCSS